MMINIILKIKYNIATINKDMFNLNNKNIMHKQKGIGLVKN